MLLHMHCLVYLPREKSTQGQEMHDDHPSQEKHDQQAENLFC